MNANRPDFEDEPEQQSRAIERHQSAAIQPYETASTALAAAAKASVEARFLLAIRQPRDIEDVRVRLMKDCKRPRFAEAARYSKPVGRAKNEETGEWEDQFIDGPSARFAEAALRHLGNMQVEATVIYDDDQQRIVRVIATDLETNATTSGDVATTKVVERRKLKSGQRPLRTRTNSYGDQLYIVAATDDEVANKVAAGVSKMRRNLILQLVPADILEECMDQCVATQDAADKADPDAARRKMLDSFVDVGVAPSQIAKLLGHETDVLNPVELRDLRAIYFAIKDGETTWRAVLESRTGDADPEDKKASSQKARVDAILQKQNKKLDAKKQKPAPTSKPTATGEVAPEDEPPPDPEDDGR